MEPSLVYIYSPPPPQSVVCDFLLRESPFLKRRRLPMGRISAGGSSERVINILQALRGSQTENSRGWCAARVNERTRAAWWRTTLHPRSRSTFANGFVSSATTTIDLGRSFELIVIFLPGRIHFLVISWFRGVPFFEFRSRLPSECRRAGKIVTHKKNVNLPRPK